MSRNNEDEKDIQFGHDELESEEELDSEDQESEGSEEEVSEETYDENSDSEVDSEDDEHEIKSDKKPKKRDKAQTRINILQRERYRAINEAERLRAEAERLRLANEELERSRDLSSQAAMRQYDDNLSTRFNQAKKAAADAIESGDSQAQADAQAELSFVTNQIHELNNWKQRDEYERIRNQYVRQEQFQQPQPQQQQPTAHPDSDYITQSWMEDNPWFDQSNSEYDPELAEAANELSVIFDNDLRRRGISTAIRSPEYFQEFDKVLNECRVNRENQRASQRGQLNMKPVRGGASPARGQGYAGQHSQQMREKLSPAEREIAAAMKVSDAEYLRQKMSIRSQRGGR